MPQQLREGGVITVIYRRSESLGAQPGPLTPKFRASPEPKAFSWEHLSPSLHPHLETVTCLGGKFLWRVPKALDFPDYSTASPRDQFTRAGPETQ